MPDAKHPAPPPGREAISWRSTMVGWQTVAPSAVAFHDGDRAPAELSHADLARIKAAFVASALRAQRLGFELIELHAAHGYLAAPVSLAAQQPAPRRVRRFAGEPNALSAGSL
ncbi:FMN oxidoreductase [Klebsiella pneumoniae]|uniref:FMN oxidoreductase n=1 Tax=Klebsiella pneumoniae TaxID=573 RepID=A0A377V3H8_KLEPN|nr:FMN oxidoreductase [Klebsiella pneumoniae]